MSPAHQNTPPRLMPRRCTAVELTMTLAVACSTVTGRPRRLARLTAMSGWLAGRLAGDASPSRSSTWRPGRVPATRSWYHRSPSYQATSMPVRRMTMVCSTPATALRASSARVFSGSTAPRRHAPSWVNRILGARSSSRSARASAGSGVGMIVCTAPMRAQASMATTVSGSQPRCRTTRSPGTTPRPRSPRVSASTSSWSCWKVSDLRSPGSPSQRIATWSARCGRCWSTQMADALSCPPANHSPPFAPGTHSSPYGLVQGSSDATSAQAERSLEPVMPDESVAEGCLSAMSQCPSGGSGREPQVICHRLCLCSVRAGWQVGRERGDCTSMTVHDRHGDLSWRCRIRAVRDQVASPRPGGLLAVGLLLVLWRGELPGCLPGFRVRARSEDATTGSGEGWVHAVRVAIQTEVVAVDPVDVDDLSSDEHLDVDGRADLVAELHQVRSEGSQDRQPGQVLVGQPGQLWAQAIPGGTRVLFDQVSENECTQQPM